MQFTLLSGLTSADVRGVLARARHRRFQAGDTVFHQGDRGSSIHLVAAGQFALRVTAPDGRTALPWIFGPGDTFGSVLTPTSTPERAASMIALSAAESYELYPERLDALRAQHPEVERTMLLLMRQYLTTTVERYLELLLLDADSRVLRRLAEQAKRHHSEGGLTPIPLRQEDLADLAGTSRSTVNRVLRVQAARGTLRQRRGRIEILDEAALARQAGEPFLGRSRLV